jgi:hypothetical protein
MTIKAARAPSFLYAGVVAARRGRPRRRSSAQLLVHQIMKRARGFDIVSFPHGIRVIPVRDPARRRDRRLCMARSRDRVGGCRACGDLFAAGVLESPGARAFLTVPPGAQRLERRLGTVPSYVLRARPAI